MSEDIILFQAPVHIKPEFRLYYDENGVVLYYTTEDLPGNYIIIDAQIFAECRYDIRVINGEIVRNKSYIFIEKLVESTVGTPCHSQDVSIIVDENFETIKFWSIKVYEYGT